MRLTRAAAVVTIGSIHGGVRSNIIPEDIVYVGNHQNPRRFHAHNRTKTLGRNR